MCYRILIVLVGFCFLFGCSDSERQGSASEVNVELSPPSSLDSPSHHPDRINRNQLITQWFEPLFSDKPTTDWQAKFPMAFFPAQTPLSKQLDYLLVAPSFAVGLGKHSLMTAVTEPVLDRTQGAWLLNWKFIGANDDAVVTVGKSEQGRQYHYVGPKKFWRSEVERYSHVIYRDLYKGADLVLRADLGKLSYAFFLERASLSSQITMQLDGAKSLQLDKQGNLIVVGAAGAVVHSAPKAFEVVGTGRTEVAVKFRLLGDNAVAFDVAYSNPDAALMIDPEIEFVSYLGGENNESTHFDVLLSGQRKQALGLDVTADAQVLVAGKAASPQMLLGEPGRIDGLSDAFLLSFDPDYILNSGQNRINYLTFYGGSGVDFATDVVAAGESGAFMSGYSASADLVLTAGTVGDEKRASPSFVLQLDNTGSLLRAAMIGVDQPFYVTSMALDVDDDEVLYVAGHAAETTNEGAGPEVTQGAFMERYGGGARDGFVAKLNRSLSQYRYLTLLGGAGEDYIHGIDVDRGRAYVTGMTNSTDFPVSDFAHQSALTPPERNCDISAWANYCNDAFLAAFNGEGTNTTFSTYYGTPFPESATAVAVAPNRRVNIVGGRRFSEGDDISKAFMAEFASDGSLLEEGGFEGVLAVVEDIFVGSEGSLNVTGTTDRPGMEDSFGRGHNQHADLFYARYPEVEANRSLFRYVGGDDRDYGLAIAGYAAGESACLVSAGVTHSSDIITVGALPDGQRYRGAGDILLAGWCYIDSDGELPVESIRKQGPETLSPGETGQYTITIDNNDGQMEGQILVEDCIAASLLIEGYSSACVRGLEPQLVSCTESAPGGSLVLSIDVRLADDACEPDSPRVLENIASLSINGFPVVESNTVTTRVNCHSVPVCPAGQIMGLDGVCCEDLNHDSTCDNICPAEMGLPFSINLPHEVCEDGEVCGVICTNVCDGIEIGNNCWFGDYFSMCPKFSCQSPSPNLQLHELWQN